MEANEVCKILCSHCVLRLQTRTFKLSETLQWHLIDFRKKAKSSVWYLEMLLIWPCLLFHSIS